MHKRTLTDGSLGFCTFLLAGMFFLTLQSRTVSVPKVLAYSTHVCGTEAGDECGSGTTKKELVDGVNRTFTCNASCQWTMPTIDTLKVTPDVPHCCLSDGFRSQCYPMTPLQTCEASAAYPYAQRFTSRNGCYAVRTDPTCGTVPRPIDAQLTRCGDGAVQKPNGSKEMEQCDPQEKGKERSNSLPNRCRINCRYPACGDGVLDDNYVDGTYRLRERCENADPVVSPSDWEWNRHPTCSNDCTVKAPETSPVYFMFKGVTESTLWFIRPLIDWQSVFQPFSTTNF